MGKATQNFLTVEDTLEDAASIDGAVETRSIQISEELPKMATIPMPVASQFGEGELSQDVLDKINDLLRSGLFHLYAKVGNVTVKIRLLHLNPFDHNYVDLTATDEMEDIKITMLWSVKLVTYIGFRKWVW